MTKKCKQVKNIKKYRVLWFHPKLGEWREYHQQFATKFEAQCKVSDITRNGYQATLED